MAMTQEERAVALVKMKRASENFYRAAITIGNHPFIEFTGIINEYINMCYSAHGDGIDFSECNTHSGVNLPMAAFQVEYVNEKLECIFTGRSIVQTKPKRALVKQQSED